MGEEGEEGVESDVGDSSSYLHRGEPKIEVRTSFFFLPCSFARCIEFDQQKSWRVQIQCVCSHLSAERVHLSNNLRPSGWSYICRVLAGCSKFSGDMTGGKSINLVFVVDSNGNSLRFVGHSP